MNIDTEDHLIEKLRRIEALFARGATAGERVAAEHARERIRQRLRQMEKAEQPVEYRFSFADTWSRSLFVALLRRYELAPYRYRGPAAHDGHDPDDEVVRERGAVARVPGAERHAAHSPGRPVTARVIRQAISGDDADIEERPGQAPAHSAAQGAFSVE